MDGAVPKQWKKKKNQHLQNEGGLMGE